MATSWASVSDMFCGCGGSSEGAVAAGAEIVIAANHWELAVKSHNANHPNALHIQADISNSDPRRWPSTTMLLASPECTNHSLAKGRKAAHYTKDLFGNVILDPSEERSRATMWDVVRFSEHHEYQIVIVENVLDVRRWRLYDAWLTAMHALGYAHKAVCLNSLVCHPTPQSRDRYYVVFWRAGNRAPDLDIRPRCYCPRCERTVDGVQTWKRADRRYGKYGRGGQYIYTCPDCHGEASPYYYPAATAIDWTLPITRIGDRTQPLAPTTIDRIRRGLERFACQPILTETLHTNSAARRARSAEEPWPTQSARQSFALVRPPVGVVELRNHGTVRSLDAPLATVAAGGNHHGLITPFVTRHYTSTGNLSRPVTDPLGTVTATDHHSLTVPFLASYYGTTCLRPVTAPVATITGLDKHALVEPGNLPDVEDCGFRMLEPAEIKRAMAFRDDYIVYGNKREQVKQAGNAVTPPAMRELVSRCLETLQ